MFGVWYQQQHMAGKRLLTVLGGPEAQREILGQEYDAVCAAIEGGMAVRPPLANLGLNNAGTGRKRGQGSIDPMTVNVSKKPRL
jgi:hypothetical protein